MPIPTRVYRDIENAVRDGRSLNEIEDDLIGPLKIGSDLMASLWLYAWGLRQRAIRSDDGADKRGGRRRQGGP